MKKRKNNNDNRYEDYDYYDFRKSVKRGENKKKRHDVNRHIRDIIHGDITPEEYEEQYEDFDRE